MLGRRTAIEREEGEEEESVVSSSLLVRMYARLARCTYGKQDEESRNGIQPDAVWAAPEWNPKDIADDHGRGAEGEREHVPLPLDEEEL